MKRFLPVARALLPAGSRLVSTLFRCATLLLMIPAVAQQSSPNDPAGVNLPPEFESDTLLRAMRDELSRSRGLKLMGVDTPYFIEYSVEDATSFAASATLGALISSRSLRFRIPRVQVRVGTPEFDNTNSIFTDIPGGGRFDSDQMPLDDNYVALRQHLWLATDRAYKGAVQAISRKRAALRNVTQNEEIANFAPAKPVQIVLKPIALRIDEPAWQARARSLSAVFRAYPQVLSSTVDFEAVQNTSYYLNTEGGAYRTPDPLVIVRARASAQAPDGMFVRDAVTFHALSAERLPSELELRRALEKLAADVTALAQAPRGDRYSGPVLFEAQAAAQLFADVLAKNFAIPRKPVSTPNYPVPFLTSELEGRVGSRILPEWIDVVDDPTQKEWRGRPLFGYYPIDLEGVPPVPLTLVEKGVLKNYLMTRQPVRGYSGSNGRARLPGAFGARNASIGNLFVRASHTVTAPELRKNLLDMVQKRGLPFGIVIRGMDYPSSASAEELRRISAAVQSSGSTRPVSSPILMYRIYPDGKEELVRGVRFRGVTVRSLKDIIAASDESFAFDYLENNALFALIGGAGYVAPTTVIAPAVLFEDLELDRIDDELPKPAVVPAPVITQLR